MNSPTLTKSRCSETGAKTPGHEVGLWQNGYTQKHFNVMLLSDCYSSITLECATFNMDAVGLLFFVCCPVKQNYLASPSPV